MTKLASLLLFSSLSWAASGTGTISTIVEEPQAAGKVHVTGAGGDRSLGQGESFGTGDTLETGAGQTVVVDLSDGSEVTIAPFSRLGIPAGSDAEVGVGTVHFLVTPRKTGQKPFTVHTGAASIGVRGTDFVVETPGNAEASVHVLSGRVAFADVVVNAGSMSHKLNGAAHADKPAEFDRKAYLATLTSRVPTFVKRMQSRHARKAERTEKRRRKK